MSRCEGVRPIEQKIRWRTLCRSLVAVLICPCHLPLIMAALAGRAAGERRVHDSADRRRGLDRARSACAGAVVSHEDPEGFRLVTARQAAETTYGFKVMVEEDTGRMLRRSSFSSRCSFAMN